MVESSRAYDSQVMRINTPAGAFVSYASIICILGDILMNELGTMRNIVSSYVLKKPCEDPWSLMHRRDCPRGILSIAFSKSCTTSVAGPSSTSMRAWVRELRMSCFFLHAES